MKRVDTCYSPYIVNNLYAINVRRLIEQNGYNTYPIKKVFQNPRLFLSCKIFNFNWFEKADNARQFYLKALLLDFLNLTGKKIIYTIHNKKPHNIEKSYWSEKLMKKMCMVSDKIVGLCPDTEEVIEDICPDAVSKLVIIQHPNYISNYANDSRANFRKKYSFKEDDMVFLFMGFVSPYKNLELLIETFKEITNPHIKLLIAGKPCSKEYKEELEKQIGNCENIKVDFRYIPDDEMVCYYNTSNIVILPYHKTSSLNSGAVYLTFSLGKTVICPDIGTINALKDKTFVYEYHYDDEAKHAEMLKKRILDACNDFYKNPKAIYLKGQAAFEYVKKEHSDEEIAKEYKVLYSELCKRSMSGDDE